jgi:hypothetical protein
MEERKGDSMEDKSFQDYYAEEVSHCYGCGRLNEESLHIRSFWEGDESVARLLLPGCLN